MSQALHEQRQRLGSGLSESIVSVRDIHGHWLERWAISEVITGHDFPVVLVCTVEERRAAHAETRESVCIPWPAEDVMRSDRVAIPLPPFDALRGLLAVDPQAPPVG